MQKRALRVGDWQIIFKMSGWYFQNRQDEKFYMLVSRYFKESEKCYSGYSCRALVCDIRVGTGWDSFSTLRPQQR